MPRLVAAAAKMDQSPLITLSVYINIYHWTIKQLDLSFTHRSLMNGVLVETTDLPTICDQDVLKAHPF